MEFRIGSAIAAGVLVLLAAFVVGAHTVVEDEQPPVLRGVEARPVRLSRARGPSRGHRPVGKLANFNVRSEQTWEASQ